MSSPDTKGGDQKALTQVDEENDDHEENESRGKRYQQMAMQETIRVSTGSHNDNNIEDKNDKDYEEMRNEILGGDNQGANNSLNGNENEIEK